LEEFVVLFSGDGLLIRDDDKTLVGDLPSMMSDNVRFRVSGFSKSSSLSSSLSLREPFRYDALGVEELWDSLSWSTYRNIVNTLKQLKQELFPLHFQH
jgi:hypothetical protein